MDINNYKQCVLLKWVVAWLFFKGQVDKMDVGNDKKGGSNVDPWGFWHKQVEEWGGFNWDGET